MNTHRFHRSFSFAALALSLGPTAFMQTTSAANPPPGAATNPPPISAPPSQRAGDAISNAAQAVSNGVANVSRKLSHVASSLRTASADEQDHATDKLIGRTVQDGQGNELGQVKDFLIDSQSGQIRFAVVSGGGLFGVGDTSRMIPFSSLQSAGDHYTVSLSKSEWSQLPPVAPQAEASGMAVADTSSATGSAGPYATTGSAASQLVRATALQGREVRSGTATLGTIDTVIINPNTSRAAALLKPGTDVATTTHEIVLPWTQLSLSSGTGGAISTSLTKADIQAAAPEHSQYAAQDRSSNRTFGGNMAATASAGPQVDPNLSPTGQTSADQNPDADPKVLAAARAVRQALDGDPTLGRADIRVMPQNGRLVLSGNVDTPALRSTVERLATQSAQGIAIDDQLTVSREQ